MLTGVGEGGDIEAELGFPSSDLGRESSCGVDGRLTDFGGPSSGSSERRLAKSTVSRNVMAASKFTKQ